VGALATGLGAPATGLETPATGFGALVTGYSGFEVNQLGVISSWNKLENQTSVPICPYNPLQREYNQKSLFFLLILEFLMGG